MKRAIAILMFVLVFGFVYASGNGNVPAYNNYNGNNPGYIYGQQAGSNAPLFTQDMIVYGWLNGSNVNNSDGSMDVTLTLKRVPNHATYMVVYRKIGDGNWEAIYSLNLLYGIGAFINGHNGLTGSETITGLQSGDTVSYQVVFYGGIRKNIFLGVTNVVTLVYE